MANGPYEPAVLVGDGDAPPTPLSSKWVYEPTTCVLLGEFLQMQRLPMTELLDQNLHFNKIPG